MSVDGSASAGSLTSLLMNQHPQQQLHQNPQQQFQGPQQQFSSGVNPSGQGQGVQQFDIFTPFSPIRQPNFNDYSSLADRVARLEQSAELNTRAAERLRELEQLNAELTSSLLAPVDSSASSIVLKNVPTPQL